MEELLNFPRLTRKKEVQDCPIAKKREKTQKKRKVSCSEEKLGLVLIFLLRLLKSFENVKLCGRTKKPGKKTLFTHFQGKNNELFSDTSTNIPTLSRK